MNKFSVNDINVLDYFGKKGIRHKNPIHFIPLFDEIQKKYHMSRDEIRKSLDCLEKIGYVEDHPVMVSLTKVFDDQIYGQRSRAVTNSFSLEQKKAARFKMLAKLYDLSDGSENAVFNIHEIGELLNFPSELVELTYEYLSSERLIEFKALGGFAAITHYGVIQYESAISVPDNETKYFPPVNIINNILNVDSIANSQVQVGVSNSTQRMNMNNDFAEIAKWLDYVEKTLLSENQSIVLEKIKDDIELIKVNIGAERPNKKYINIALNAIRDVFIDLTSNVLFQTLISTMPKLIP
ncbi:hypothetical protein AGMMS49944_10360 [Spirochaetia bacterium]|nr:hypothetical protein AGMMS49944_10360 [Spirochaetia bacterium]